MNYLELVLIFITSVAFSIIFNSPPKTLIFSGIIGFLGWMVFRFSYNLGISYSMAIFIAAVVVALLSEIMARFLRHPVTIFVIPSIIPLVPGGTAYQAMLAFVKGNYIQGISYGTETLFAAGSIAAGLAFLTISFRMMKNIH